MVTLMGADGKLQNLFKLADGSFPSVLSCAGLCGKAQILPEFARGTETLDSRSQLFRICRRNEDTVQVGFDEIRHAARARGDYRHGTGHCLEKRQRHSFDQGREDKDVMGVVEIRHGLATKKWQ